MKTKQLILLLSSFFTGYINLTAMNKQRNYLPQKEIELEILLASLTPETEWIYKQCMSESVFINSHFGKKYARRNNTKRKSSPNPINTKKPICSYCYPIQSHYSEESLPAKHSLWDCSNLDK